MRTPRPARTSSPLPTLDRLAAVLVVASVGVAGCGEHGAEPEDPGLQPVASGGETVRVSIQVQPPVYSPPPPAPVVYVPPAPPPTIVYTPPPVAPPVVYVRPAEPLRPVHIYHVPPAPPPPVIVTPPVIAPPGGIRSVLPTPPVLPRPYVSRPNGGVAVIDPASRAGTDG